MSYKIYVIYSFANFKCIENLLKAVNDYNEQKQANDRDISIFYFKKENEKVISSDGYTYVLNDESWKDKAKKKLDDADLICFYMDSLNNEKDYSNVKYEYEYASKNNKKIITIKSDDKPLTHEAIEQFFKDENYGQAIDKRETISESQILNNAKFRVRDSILIDDESDLKRQDKALYYNLLLEQYKIMIDTSESLINRRQAMSNLYTGIGTALISLVGTSFALKDNLVIGIIFFCVGLVLTIISATWLVQLASYNQNNYGKYEVINAIEEKLPANMFDVEYKFNKNQNIKTYSKREKLLPIAFIIISGIFLVFGVVMFFIGLF